MENKQTIDFTGTSHQRHAARGTMAHMMNLRHERGVLRPITPKQQLSIAGALAHPSASNYVMQFVHENSDFSHWIGITAAGVVEWYDPVTGHPIIAGYSGGTPFTTIATLPGVTQIVSLKNFLIFISPTEVAKFIFVPSKDYCNGSA